MKDLNLQVSYFIGSVSKTKWVGAHGLFLEDKLENSGNLFFLISLQSTVEVDLSKLGGFLKDELLNKYYNDNEDPLPLLTQSCLSTSERLKLLIQKEKIVSEKGVDLDITAVVVKKNVVYASTMGKGGIFLKRGKNLINVSDSLKDISGKNSVKVGSLYLNLNDVLILMSAEALFSFKEDEIKNSAVTFDLNEFEKKSDKEKLGSAVMLIKSEEKEEDIDVVDAEEEEILQSDYPKTEKESSSSKYLNKFKSKVKNANLKGHVGKASEITKRTISKSKSKIKEFSEKERVQSFIKGIKPKTIRIWNVLKTFVVEKILGFKEGKIYLRGSGQKKSLRGIIILLVVVLLILFFSIRAISSKNKMDASKKEEETLLLQIDEYLSTASELKGTQTALNYINDAKSNLEKAKAIGLLKEDEQQKEAKIKVLEDKFNKVVRVDDSILLAGLAGSYENVSTYDIDISGNYIYISDTDRAAIYRVSYDGGEVEEVLTKINGLSAPKSIKFDMEGNLIIFDSDKGLLKANMEEKTVEQIPGLSVNSIGNVVQLEYYQNPDQSEYIYYLINDTQQINRSQKLMSGFGFPEKRYESSEFSNSRDFEIDMGSGNRVYVLTPSDPGIIRFMGDLDPFDIQGLDKSLKGSGGLETDDNYLYFGDSANGRVVVTSKGRTDNPQIGDMILQYVYDSDKGLMRDIKDLKVDNGNKTMFLLDGNNILKLDLQKIEEFL